MNQRLNFNPAATNTASCNTESELPRAYHDTCQPIGRMCRLLLGAAILSWGTLAWSYELKLPFHDSSLPADTYIRTSGHGNYNCSPDLDPADRNCAHDIDAVRWDNETGNWSKWNAGSGSNPSPADNVMWGMPLYSPKDGHILACWRRMPDDMVEGDSNNCPGGEQDKCAKGGNFLSILTEDGNLINLQHLRQDSIPPDLCPIDEVYVYAGDPKTCNLPRSEGYSAYFDATRLDLRDIDPIPVKKGQFVARAGTTGRSGGVHLHLSVREYAHDGSNPCRGPNVPMEFVESWYQQRFVGVAPTEDWIELLGEQLPIDGSSWLLWPDPIGPRTDSLIAGSGTRPQVVLGESFNDAALGTVAYRNNAGNLVVGAVNLIDGELSILDEEQAGAVGRLALTDINNGDHVVAALVNGAGNLQVIPYARFGASIERGTGRTEGAATRVAATATPYWSGFVAAARNGSNRLSVISYDVDETNDGLSIRRNDSATGPTEVKQIAIATVRAGRARDNDFSKPFRGVVTAERRSADNAIVVRSWRVDPAGNITQTDADTARDLASNTPFEVNDVDITVVGDTTREYVVVSSRLKSSLDLRSQTFEINAEGHLARIDQDDAGNIYELALTATGTADVVTAVAKETQDLATISWQIEPGNNFDEEKRGLIRRSGRRDAGFISAVDVAASQTNMLLAVRNANGEIKLITYRTNYWDSE